MVVAQKLEQSAVELVGSGPELHIHVRSRVATVFGRVVSALHLEFLDRFDRRIQVDVIGAVIDHGDAIQVHLLPGVARAVGDDA